MDKKLKKVYDQIIKGSAEKIWCASGHCVEDMQTGGFDHEKVAHKLALSAFPGFARLPNPARKALVAGMLGPAAGVVDYLLDAPLRWQVWYGAFCSDGKENWCDWDIWSSGTPVKTSTVADRVEPLITKLAAKKNPNHLISPGWFAVPSETVDLAAMADDITETFRQWGAFDEEHCRIVWGLREIENSKEAEK